MNPHRLFRRVSNCLLVSAFVIAPWNISRAAPGADTDSDSARVPEMNEAAGEPTEATTAEEDGTEDGMDADATEEGTDDDATEDEDATEDATDDEDATDGEESEDLAAAEGPIRPDEPRWGKANQKSMKGTGMIVVGSSATVLGAAFIGIAFAITGCDYDSALKCRFEQQRDLLIPTAITATGTGLLLLGVGLGLRSQYKRWKNWTPDQAMVAPTLLKGGGGFAVSGRF